MMTDPTLTLTFTANDLEPGHNTTQYLTDEDLVRGSFDFKYSRLNGLKSSSDTIGLQIRKGCAAIEDIIATEGDIEAVLSDDGVVLFTGYVSTSYSWGITDHGDQALNVTLESIGTRLFNKPFIETGKHFFDCTAAAAVSAIVTPLGVTIKTGEDAKLPQNVKRTVEAGESCRDLLDSLFYECNCVYYFDDAGQMCYQQVTANTAGASVYDKTKLRMVDKKVVSLSKKLRTYSGARVAYTELASANNYLVYRNTTGQDDTHPYCNLELQAGEYFDGTEIYTAQEWSDAQADTFREPALIGATNAASESQIVGSNKIVSISNLSPDVVGAGMTCVFENVGGGYFKLTAHNESGGARSFTKMDLKASIIYVKSNGVIRTQIDGPSAGKSILEEEMKWIHDKNDATKHANLVAQYHRYASASYTFYTNDVIPLGSVVKLHDNVFSGLEVYVLVTASQKNDSASVIAYSAVGVSTFDLDQDAYHGISEPAKPSGRQGPPGPQGDSVVVEYALGTYYEPTYPPSEEMAWEMETMTWENEAMEWGLSPWSATVPTPARGQCIWMRTKVGDSPWQISRLTGLMAWESECVGVATTAVPTETKDGDILIRGDYFIAGEDFTQDGVEYKQGYTYQYDGVGYWFPLDLSTTTNASKILGATADLLQSGINVEDTTAAIWGIFANLAFQNGVARNLFAQALYILDNGFLKGGDRYDDTGVISDWKEDGFWFGSDGRLMASLQSDGNGNTFVGTGVAQYDQSSVGYYNTAIGYEALYYNDTGGDWNVAIGYRTLYNTTTGRDNVAIGEGSLYDNTTGSYNISIGSNALRDNTTGEENIAIGSLALTGGNASYNVAIGYYAGIGTTGENNVMIGSESGRYLDSGRFNLLLGYKANPMDNDGNFQINLNDSIIHVEFKSTRAKSRIYGALHDAYYSSSIGAKNVGAMGIYNGYAVVSLEFDASSITIKYVNGTAISSETITSSSSGYPTGRTMLTFVNPLASSRTDDSTYP